jgi:ribosomal protein S25
MDKNKLFDSLDGLFAYDSGCTDSGIKDEAHREEVKSYLNSLDDNEFRTILSEFVRERYLTDKALEQRYGIEDVANFIRWLSEHMQIDL